MMGNYLEPLGEELFKGNPAGKYRLDCLQNISSFLETSVLCTNLQVSKSCQLTLRFIFIVLFVQGNVHAEHFILERMQGVSGNGMLGSSVQGKRITNKNTRFYFY